MRVTMDDGAQSEVGPGDVFALPPGHDAETIGDEPCVALDFGSSATTQSAAKFLAPQPASARSLGAVGQVDRDRLAQLGRPGSAH